MNKKQKIINYLMDINYAENRESRPTIREIAAATETSVGMVHKTVRVFLYGISPSVTSIESERSEQKSEQVTPVKTLKTPSRQAIVIKKITKEDIETFAQRITEESLHFVKAQKLLKRITHKYGTGGIARDAFVVNYTLMVVNFLLSGEKPEEV